MRHYPIKLNPPSPESIFRYHSDEKQKRLAAIHEHISNVINGMYEEEEAFQTLCELKQEQSGAIQYILNKALDEERDRLS